jgi:hypothetical protein
MIAINLFLDNCKSIFLLIEILQSVHMLLYLDIWYHPVLENLMHGLGFSAFYFDISKFMPYLSDRSEIWDCTAKKILYFNYCNFKGNLITVAIFAIVFLLIAIAGKFILTFLSTHHHKIFWNHINNFYWIILFVLYFGCFDAPY